MKKHLIFVKELETEYIFRCPICGDSQKRLTGHGHFYINKENGMFYCHRCNATGNIYSYLLKYENLDIKDKKMVLQQILNTNNSVITHTNKTLEYFDDYTILKDIFLNTNVNQYLTDKHIFQIYNKYIDKRLKGVDVEFIKKELLFKLIYPFYSVTPVYYPSYMPALLLNRIYFKHYNYIFSARQIDGIKDSANKTYSSKYIFMKPKIINSIYPFVMYDKLPIHNIYLVEGVFDVIKLYYFLSFEEENYIVMTTNGKRIGNILQSFIYDIVSQYKVNKIVWIPDIDVEREIIMNSIEPLKSIFRSRLNTYIPIYIGQTQQYKDIGDMDNITCLKSVDLYKYETFKLIPVFKQL